MIEDDESVLSGSEEANEASESISTQKPAKIVDEQKEETSENDSKSRPIPWPAWISYLPGRTS